MLDSSGIVWDRFEPNRLNAFLPFEKIARFRNHFESLKAVRRFTFFQCIVVS